MTNETINQKLDCIWNHLRRLLEEMNIHVADEDWPDESGETSELPPVKDDS